MSSMEFMEEVFTELRAKKVRYVVIGGVAAVLHGIVRLTFDLDLVVLLHRDNLVSFLDVMKFLGMKPRVPVDPNDLLNPDIVAQWKKEKGMKAFTFINPLQPGNDIDLLIEEVIPFDEVERDAVTFELWNIPVKVISIPHLKRMKEISGRPQDLADLASFADLENADNES